MTEITRRRALRPGRGGTGRDGPVHHGCRLFGENEKYFAPKTISKKINSFRDIALFESPKRSTIERSSLASSLRVARNCLLNRCFLLCCLLAGSDYSHHTLNTETNNTLLFCTDTRKKCVTSKV